MINQVELQRVIADGLDGGLSRYAKNQRVRSSREEINRALSRALALGSQLSKFFRSLDKENHLPRPSPRKLQQIRSCMQGCFKSPLMPSRDSQVRARDGMKIP